jgi:hypothetical protein
MMITYVNYRYNSGKIPIKIITVGSYAIRCDKAVYNIVKLFSVVNQ